MGIRTMHFRHIKPRSFSKIGGIFYAFVEKQFCGA